MTETHAQYLPDRTAAFMVQAPPAERLMRLQRQMGLVRDQQRLLRLVATNMRLQIEEGGEADIGALLDLLDGCVEGLGRLVEGAS